MAEEENKIEKGKTEEVWGKEKMKERGGGQNGERGG